MNITGMKKLNENYKPDWDVLSVINLGCGTFNICLWEHKAIQCDRLVSKIIIDTEMSVSVWYINTEFREILIVSTKTLIMTIKSYIFNDSNACCHIMVRRPCYSKEIFASLKATFYEVVEDFYCNWTWRWVTS